MEQAADALHAELRPRRAARCSRPPCSRLGAGRRPFLFLTAHHLVVDGVSWRILLDDLDTAYQQARRGEPVDLGREDHLVPGLGAAAGRTRRRPAGWTTSWRTGRRGAGRRARCRSTASRPTRRPPTRYRAGRAGRARHRGAAALARPTAYRTRINDVLLAALALGAVPGGPARTGSPSSWRATAGRRSSTASTFPVRSVGSPRCSRSRSSAGRGGTRGGRGVAAPTGARWSSRSGDSCGPYRQRLRLRGAALLRAAGGARAAPGRFPRPGRVQLPRPVGRPVAGRRTGLSTPCTASLGQDHDPRRSRLRIRWRWSARCTNGQLGFTWYYRPDVHEQSTVEPVAADFADGLRADRRGLPGGDAHRRDLRLSRNRNYRLLWGSQALSEFGFNATDHRVPAAGARAHRLGGRIRAGAGHARRGPARGRPAGGRAGGPLATARVMLACEAAQALAGASLVLALWWGVASVPHMVVVAAVLVSCAALFEPAEDASLPDLVPAEQLSTAVAMNSARASWATCPAPRPAGSCSPSGGSCRSWWTCSPTRSPLSRCCSCAYRRAGGTGDAGRQAASGPGDGRWAALGVGRTGTSGSPRSAPSCSTCSSAPSTSWSSCWPSAGACRRDTSA